MYIYIYICIYIQFIHLRALSVSNFKVQFSYTCIFIVASSTAQGSGGSFKNRKPTGESPANPGWQSESTDGRNEWLQWLQWSPIRSPQPQMLDVVLCSAAVVVVLVAWNCSCGVV